MAIMAVESVIVKKVGKVPNVMSQRVNVKYPNVPVTDVVSKVNVIVNVAGKDSFVINVSILLFNCKNVFSLKPGQ